MNPGRRHTRWEGASESTELKSGIICIALLAGLAPAQDQKPQTATAREQANKSKDQDSTGLSPDGPALLSRDKGLIGQRGGKLLDFRFYGEITGVYDSGLTPVTVSPPSNLAGIGADYGMEAGIGMIGSRLWKHDKLSLEYRGKERQYSNNPLFNGADHFLNLRYSHALLRHLVLDLKETAGRTTLANGAFAFFPLTNTDLFAVPANELFDNRTNYFQSRVDLLWQKSARLSFQFGGEGFLVRRQAFALAGLNGYSARADIAYRLTRRQTVSAIYKHTYFDFQRSFGDATIQTASLAYSVTLSRKWDFGVQLGGCRVDTLGLTQVSIDPAIAAIIGRNAAIVSFSRALLVPLAEARLIRRFDRSALTLGYSSGVSPGNGVYLTSRQTAGTADYSYTGYRRFTTALSASYNQLSTLGQSLGKYTNMQGGGGITYRLIRDTHLELRYDYRHYTTQDAFYKKNSSRVSIGLAFSPGEKPLAIW